MTGLPIHLRVSFSEYFIVSLKFLFAFSRAKGANINLFLPISGRKTILSSRQEGEHVLIGRADASTLYLDYRPY